LGFNLSGETRRTNLDVSYTVSQDYYAKYHQLDGYRQNFVSNGNIELIEDHFYIDGRLTFTEESLDSTGATAASDRTQSSGRTQVLNGSFSPYYVQDFGDWMLATARYGYSETRFFDPNVGESSTDPSNQKSHEYQLKFDGGLKFDTYKWSFDNKLLVSESDVGDEFTHASTTTTGELPISRMFSLLGTVGYDNFDISNVDKDDELGGFFLGGGLRFHPNNRTDISFQVGHRFDDIIYDMDASYKPTSQDSITATYKVTINSADYSLANTDVLDDQGELIRPNFSAARYVDDVTKSKILDLRWNGSRGRNSYQISGSLIEREILSDNSSERIAALNGNYTRQLTPRADLRVNAGISDVLDGSSPTDEEAVYNLGATYSYEFGNGLRGTASYNNLTRDNDSTDDIIENSISFSIRKTF